MSAHAESLDEMYNGSEKLKRCEPHLRPKYLRVRQHRSSEAPSSNDNGDVDPAVADIDCVEAAIDEQHGCIGQLMHKRNADPKNEELKQELDDAFVKLERLEERRAELLRPYLAVKVPGFSEDERRLIDEVERARSTHG